MRIQGPSLADNRRAGDKFAELVMRNISMAVKIAARNLDSTSTPDDLAPLRRHWEARIDSELLMALRREWFREANATLRSLEDAATKADEALTAAAVDIVPVRDVLAEAYLASARNRLVAVGDETWQHARDQMLIGLQEGDSIKQLQSRVTSATELARPRAEVVARTEVIGASNRGAIEQMYAAGLSATKEWIATNDSRTRPTHHAVDGTKVGLKEEFMVGGASMDGPHDPKGPASETISCRCTLGFDVEEEDLTIQSDEQSLTADAFHLRGHHVQRAHTRTALRVGEPHTGAMIALVPRAEDLKRLPINGGEPKSELHLTLWFLGDAVDHSNDARETLITALSENHPGPVQGRAFGAAYWNPTGDEPCWVLNVGELPTEPDEDTMTTTGHWSLEQARALTADALLQTQLSVPEQHAPWSPHICLAYAKDTSLIDEMSHRVGTVTFDTLRIAFGDEVTDIDLGAPK